VSRRSHLSRCTAHGPSGWCVQFIDTLGSLVGHAAGGPSTNGALAVANAYLLQCWPPRSSRCTFLVAAGRCGDGGRRPQSILHPRGGRCPACTCRGVMTGVAKDGGEWLATSEQTQLSQHCTCGGMHYGPITVIIALSRTSGSGGARVHSHRYCKGPPCRRFDQGNEQSCEMARHDHTTKSERGCSVEMGEGVGDGWGRPYK
jgi:hypothetical protein